ncbi:MAG: hypothetical protein RIR26_775 [Pseudomonadota bacterium]|jgi:tetratricopeptide (TPR) repeat protein
MQLQDILRIFRLEEVDPFGTQLDVLIIEPQNEVRLIIAQFLQKRGFGNVRAVRDGISGINELRSKPADILIVSNSLEGPVAKDVIMEVREDKNIERRAIILLSGPLSRKDIILIGDLGLDAIILKPVVLTEVLTKIKLAHENFSNQRNLERYFELAKLELREGRSEKAEQVYKALIKINEQMARPFFGLSKIAEEQSHLVEAIELAKSAISRNESYSHAHSLLGELMLKEGDVAGALESFKKAVQLSPLNLFRYEAISSQLMQSKLYDDAITILQIGFDAKLDQSMIPERLGLCYFYKKEFPKALRYLRLAVERDPENIRFLNSLAICYRDASQFDKALEIYNQILRRHNENYAVLFNKALLLSMMKRKEEALKLMERVLTIRPDFQKAKEKIDEWGGAVE